MVVGSAVVDVGSGGSVVSCITVVETAVVSTTVVVDWVVVVSGTVVDVVVVDVLVVVVALLVVVGALAHASRFTVNW